MLILDSFLANVHCQSDKNGNLAILAILGVDQKCSGVNQKCLGIDWECLGID